MQVALAHVGARDASRDGYEALINSYLKRCAGFIHCSTEAFRTEAALLEWLDKLRGRTAPAVLFLDPHGKTMTSESLAGWLGVRRDGGVQQVVFAIGPADGWSQETLAEGKRRGHLLSLGPMTLAHHLARLVAAEQIYRACTILTGHPYHRA
jgi:23S rRNA (pseudouridine1915-N3)-methyltransferase